MRRLRDVRASILSARFSLSAVSSSIELLAVLASAPSFFSRSMTSWLERFKSLASWKTLTFPIRLSSVIRHIGRAARRLRARDRQGLVRGLPRRRRFRAVVRLRLRLLLGELRLGQAALLLGLLGGEALGLHPLGLHPRRRFRVAPVPVDLARGRGLADLLRGLGSDAFDLAELLVGHLEDVGESGQAGVDELLDDLLA